MARFTIPNAPNTYTYAITDLLGVDYNDTVVDNRRSPKMVNLVNNNGFLESRFGHKILINIGEGNINGVWNIDANNEIFVVHCGTNLYEVSSDFGSKLVIRAGLADNKSTGLYLDGQLVILDGLKALIYHKVGDDWVVENLDEVGYIPTTQIARKPDGTGGRVYEGANLCTPYRKNAFLSDGASTVYQLDGETWGEETPTVTKLTTTGTFEAVEVSSWDNKTGKVTFASPIEQSPVTGRDNVFIQFKSGDIVCYINKCKFGTLYGYAGDSNRLFVSGNEDFPNIDWYSAIDDPTYFSVDNYAKIGVEPITGYSRAGDGTLVTHKKLSDTDCTVYFRTFNTVNNMEVFPLSAGVKNIGCINNYCCQNFLNDPVFLSESGIYSISTSTPSSTNEKFAEERSYYINHQLLMEDNLEDAVAIVNGYRYYLAINGHCYVADRRFLSTSDYSASNYQYEWFYLTDMPVRVFFNWNNKLYFGDDRGNIRTFDETRYYDEVNNGGMIEEKPFDVYYETPYLYFDNYVKAKTIRRLYVHTVPDIETSIELSYETPDEKTTISTITYDGVNKFPKVMQEKEKISKIMCCKLIIEGIEKVRCSFNTIIAEYRIAGKYRGE